MKIQLSVGIFLLFSTCIHAQQANSILSKTDQIVSFPGRLFSHIQRKTAALNASLDRQTEKYLDKLQRKEDRFRRRLMQKDSAAAALLAASSGKYSTIQKEITGTDTSAKGGLSGEYQPYVDSLKGNLSSSTAWPRQPLPDLPLPDIPMMSVLPIPTTRSSK
jgi:hypothetical protein